MPRLRPETLRPVSFTMRGRNEAGEDLIMLRGSDRFSALFKELDKVRSHPGVRTIDVQIDLNGTVTPTEPSARHGARRSPPNHGSVGGDDNGSDPAIGSPSVPGQHSQTQ